MPSTELNEERVLDCQAEVVRALNLVESLLTGWVLKNDTELVRKLTDPLYDLVDKDPS